MSRITLAGAIFLTVIATIPIILGKRLQIPPDVAQFFGGTSILIAVGVLLDTMRQVESHLIDAALRRLFGKKARFVAGSENLWPE